MICALIARASLPPLEACLGTRPIQAASSRPDLKTDGSVIEAASAVAVIGPMPGMLSSRRLTSLARRQAWMRFSPAMIWRSNDIN